MNKDEVSFSSLGKVLSDDEKTLGNDAQDVDFNEIEDALFGYQFGDILKKVRQGINQIVGSQAKREALIRFAVTMMIPENRISSDFSNSKTEIEGKNSSRRTYHAMKMLTDYSELLRDFQPLTEDPLFGESFREGLETARAPLRKLATHYRLIVDYKKYLANPSITIFEIKQNFPGYDLKGLLIAQVSDLARLFPASDCENRFKRIWNNYLKFRSAKKTKRKSKKRNLKEK